MKRKHKPQPRENVNWNKQQKVKKISFVRSSVRICLKKIPHRHDRCGLKIVKFVGGGNALNILKRLARFGTLFDFADLLLHIGV